MRMEKIGLDSMTKLQSKGFDPRISSDKGQYADYYTMAPSDTEITFKWTLVYASLLL